MIDTEAMQEVDIKTIIDQTTEDNERYCTVVLQDTSSEAHLNLDVSVEAGKMIESVLDGELPMKPDIYRLCSSILKGMDIDTLCIEIKADSDEEQGIYLGVVTIIREDHHGGPTIFSRYQCKASDGIILAIIASASIYTERGLLDDKEDK